jgi:hypothetical protein
MPTKLSPEIQTWPIDQLVSYTRNSRKNDAARKFKALQKDRLRRAS